MTLDVRAAARKEAELVEDEIYFAHRVVTRSGAGLAIRYFVEGAVWAVGRLPTRDEIAKVLAESNGTSWDAMPDDPSCVYGRDADAVLALIARKMQDVDHE